MLQGETLLFATSKWTFIHLFSSFYPFFLGLQSLISHLKNIFKNEQNIINLLLECVTVSLHKFKYLFKWSEINVSLFLFVAGPVVGH